ncbi:hypothetical protein ABFS83_13G144200 [Erythranthe nasuta]
MEQSKNQNLMQYYSEHGNEDLRLGSVVHSTDTLGHENANLMSSDSEIIYSDPKPVHNYSMQTGEEFSLEFMRDRTNFKNLFIPNISGDPNNVPGYMEPKAMLSASDPSFTATTEKSSRESDNRNLPLHGNGVNRESMQSMAYASSDYHNDHLSQKLKILCSFGGRILPRPSDGELRYVGGETRIVRIRKDIVWQELWEKTSAIYDETHTIKYQLPGEGLDALVSVSSDEDLLNMMEEWNVLKDGEGSQKLRIFLFSRGDLEEAHFSLANSDVDSEMRYVVAVNGMEIGLQKGSSRRGLASSSKDNLNKLAASNVERDTRTSSAEFVGITTASTAGFVAPSTANESSKSILPTSSDIYQTDSHFYHGQQKQHPPQFGYNFRPPYHSPSESDVPQSSSGAFSQQKGLEANSLSSSGTHGNQGQEKEAKLKFDGLKNGGRGNTKVNFPVEESSKSEAKPVDAFNPSQSNGNEYCTSGNAPDPESTNSEYDPTDLTYSEPSEPSVPPRRVYYSERIPREQAGFLQRTSKSDDAHSSQFLVNQSRTDNNIQQDFVSESGESFPIRNVDIPTGQSISTTGNQEEAKAAVPKTEQGDILIDINDRFPRNLLSDIFSKAILSDSSSNTGPLQNEGGGLSVNIENPEPKHWSFFQRLAGDEFTKKGISLIDQDHVFSSGLTKVEEDTPLAYDFGPLMREEDHKDLHGGDGTESIAVPSNYNASQLKADEGNQYEDSMDNRRNQDLDYEDGIGIGQIGLPPLDPSLVDFDINSLQIIQNADLEELKELGAGTFGTVYHGKWRGSDVAIKRIKKSCFTGRQSEQDRLTNEFWKEAEILSKLHHPNVVAFYGVVQDGPGATLATVTEYMVNGSLRHVLLRKDRLLDRRKRLIIAMDAAFGMEYLHSKNIVHFDLKCDNLLVNLKDPSRPICKVGDFGLSKIKRNTLVSGGVRGTLPWMAPELLNGSSNRVSEKVDVFSFGIVLWEILTGEEPYANMHYGAIIGGIVNNTLRPTIPSYCDSEWRRLMEQCWAPNPAVRPSFTEIASRLRVMSSAARKAS